MYFTKKKKYNFKDFFSQEVSGARKAWNDRGFFYWIYRLSAWEDTNRLHWKYYFTLSFFFQGDLIQFNRHYFVREFMVYAFIGCFIRI